MEKRDEFLFEKCDKNDIFVSVMVGILAGLVDAFFVGTPKDSVLGRKIDGMSDELVRKAAQFFWKNDKRTAGKPKKIPDTLERCISYMEQAFPVNYDARYARNDLITYGDEMSGMNPKNHHLLSLAHSPDIIGLIFSIIDQFTGYATFVDNGRLINVVPAKTSKSNPYMDSFPFLQGGNLPAMLFCGFMNWFGHLISDLVGSSSVRHKNPDSRGAGIPMPFYELFLFCDFGAIKDNGSNETITIANAMVKVFEQGYDVRFAAAMSIPVMLAEAVIKVFWILKARYYKKREWKECIPNSKHGDLRIMLISGNAALCLVDGTDALVRCGGNWLEFFLRLNIVAWFRLIKLVLKEVMLRLGYSSERMSVTLCRINDSLREYLEELGGYDYIAIEQEVHNMEQFDAIILNASGSDITELLYGEMRAQGISLPFGNTQEFDSFMKDKNTKLIL